MIAAVGAAAALVLLGGVIGAPVYVAPEVDPTPAHADVVYVLGPPTAARVELARALLDAGVGDTMLLSVPGGALRPGTRDHEKFRACNHPGGDVVCISPVPFTTGGEARALAELAEERRWTSAIVITRTSHVARARLLVERCFGGELAVIDAHEPLGFGGWAYQYVYQTAAFAKAFVTPDC
ncbi:ElyC/SanA/YdcF family protein [Agromyces binzhouensis]|uniref:ElyC/SanA/YdcF family protein n=1 Tax=Agromyces binzhouensis TaxID=1817495 RepID=UPI003635A4E5